MRLLVLALQEGTYEWTTLVMETGSMSSQEKQRNDIEALGAMVAKKGTDRQNYFLSRVQGKLHSVRKRVSI